MTIHLDTSIEKFYRIGNDGEPQPEAVLCHNVAQSLKWGKYPFLLFFSHARTCILH